MVHHILSSGVNALHLTSGLSIYAVRKSAYKAILNPPAGKNPTPYAYYRPDIIIVYV